MINGLHAVLSPQEEVALKRIAHESLTVDARIVTRLAELALVERTKTGLRLTALGRQRIGSLPKAPLLGDTSLAMRRLETSLTYWTEQARRLPAVPVRGDGLRGVRVLVVEDDYHQAQSFARALKDAEADVRAPSSSAAAALDMIATAAPQCAVVDIHLGNGPCYRVPHCLKDRGVPFIFVTAYDRTGLSPAFDDIECLDKPVEDSRLVSTLSRVYASTVPPVE
jgi:CheY-like chemotaxis protein